MKKNPSNSLKKEKKNRIKIFSINEEKNQKT